ncbi:hypothetical protein [Agreia sp. COWG]|uniref:hypothetical protein n=1 Tax=Agreia sp. COWG TaxID=2773266 RepID=UPI001928F69D|nr:hypothetical protein [Agreia sp. COWG]
MTTWPYPTTASVTRGGSTVAADGENQTCVCGNDSQSTDWAAGDASGNITFLASGSADADDHAICPDCGRVYQNRDLFAAAEEQPASAVTQYDIRSAFFIAALRRYNNDAYGDVL